MARPHFEIVDENGNVHGPFETLEQLDEYVESRALGEQRDIDDERGRGWYLRVPQSARERTWKS